MKKWIIILVTVYVAIGILMFSGRDESKPTLSNIVVTENENLHSKYHMYWILNDPDKSNYKPPYWLTNEELSWYVQDKTHEMEKVNPTDADDRLMTFIAELQLGESRHVSSFINPLISYKDLIGAVAVDEINLKLEEYAKLITKDFTITAVYISEPTFMTKERAYFEMTLSFHDGSVIILPDIPMVKLTEDHNWFLDITLKEVSSLIELAPKRVETSKAS